MTYAALARDYRTYVLLGLIAEAGAYVAKSTSGLLGMTLGLGAALFGVFILWQLISIIGKAVTEGGNPALGTALTIFGLFLKLPLFIFAGMAANRIGGGAPGCFLVGVMLVYFAVVAWAMARH